MRNLLLTIFAVSIAFTLAEVSCAAPIIWDGAKITFTKNDFADWTLADNQDRITDNVWITRQDRRGIFNIKTEMGYTNDFSPADTEWATGSAVDYASLNFNSWEDWHGKNPLSVLDVDAVVHLITDDIYIDIKFISWMQSAQGGGFSYERSKEPKPDPCECDLNNDGTCDGRDWLLFFPDWGRTDCNQPEVGPCECDLNSDGSCDGRDWLLFFPDWGRSDCPFIQLTIHPEHDGAPVWSPNNSKIAFNSRRSGSNSIWVMNTDGTNKIQLTNNLGDDSKPHWSADGAKIVFHSDRSGNWDIWMMDSDGSNLVQLTYNPAGDYIPDFSPDGSAIIFQSERSGNNDIWMMDSDGANPAQKKATPRERLNRLTRKLFSDVGVKSWQDCIYAT